MNQSEQNRLLHNICRIGTIAELDQAKHLVRVQIGDLKPAWLDWPAEIGGNYVRHRPLRLNTQVVLLSPSGDISQALIVGMLHSNDIPPVLAVDDIDCVEFTDGTKIQYDLSSKKLTIEVIEGEAEVKCKTANINVEQSADVKVGKNLIAEIKGNADVKVAKNLTAKANGKVNVNGASVALNDGVGVVTGACICPFTGSPHSDFSSTVKAGK